MHNLILFLFINLKHLFISFTRIYQYHVNMIVDILHLKSSSCIKHKETLMVIVMIIIFSTLQEMIIGIKPQT